MKKNIKYRQIGGFIFASALGTLLHYLYEWTGESVLVAPFSGVNESTWEHMKLLYFPLFVFAVIQSFHYKEYENFWCIKLCGIITGLLSIPVLFYTINGAFGRTPSWVNIAIFYVSAFLAFCIETMLFKKEKKMCKWNTLAFAVIVVIGVLFVVFTFATPKIPLFLDPLTGTYGVNG